MPTIGDVYNPLVQFAEMGDAKGHDELQKVGQAIFSANPDRCASVADGIEAARRNLDYYCQYFSEETAATVKAFYDLGGGFRDLSGNKWP